LRDYNKESVILHTSGNQLERSAGSYEQKQELLPSAARVKSADSPDLSIGTSDFEGNILEALRAKVIDFNLIEQNLNLMQKKEIYLMKKKIIHDRLLASEMSLPKIENLLENHNTNIDNTKLKRLDEFLKKIRTKNFQQIQQLQSRFAELPQGDLVFLLTVAIQEDSSFDIIKFLISTCVDCNDIGLGGRLPLHCIFARSVNTDSHGIVNTHSQGSVNADSH